LALVLLLGVSATGRVAGEERVEPPQTSPSAPGVPSTPPPAEEPSAEPGPGEVKPSVPAVAEEDRIDILNIDYLKLDDEQNILLGEGNIQVIVREPVTEEGVTRYEEVKVSADGVFIDWDADLAIFKGNVRIEREHVVVTQDELRVDLGTKAADAEGNIHAALATELFAGPWPVEPLFVGGDAAHVEPEANFVQAQQGSLTSCDLSKPHYFFLSPQVDVTPGRQVRLRRPRLRILGHTILRYPGSLTIPLNRQRSSVIPAFGQNRTEGIFLRMAFPYTSGKEASGAFRLNLTERRGLGIGGEHFVYARRHGGEVFVLWEPQEGSFTSRGRHTYAFSPTFTTDANASFQSNSGFARGSTESSDMGLILRKRSSDLGSTSELAIRRNETTSSFSSSRRSTVQLRDNRRYGRWLRSNVLLNFRETGVTGRADDLELSSQLELSRQNPNRPFDWRLQAERRFDLDGDSFTLDDNLSILERSPVLTLHTDTRRLSAHSFRDLLVESELSVGQFRQRPTGGDIFRTFLGFGLRPRVLKLSGSSQIRSTARFRQGFYSDGTAQYVLGTHIGLENRYGRHWESEISYDMTDPHGFSPLRFDAVGIRSAARWGLTRRAGGFSGSLVQLTGGFDFERDRHYDMLLRSRLPLARGTLLQLSSGYSLERDSFRPLLMELERVRPEGIGFGISTRYDLDRQQLGRVRGTLDWPLKKWRLELLAGYNGIRQELDFADVRVTRDLHCWTATLTYSKQQRSVMLNVGIKAFPVATPRLGQGVRGQGFGLDQGALY
jgi:LPS-assembly protein